MGKINKIRIGGIAYDISDLATQEALENEIERAGGIEEELKNEDLKIKAIAELCKVEVDKLKSEQSDLSDKVDTKQNTLISGNNIKTVNGLSLVGSGNIDLATLSGSSSADAAPIASTLNFTTTEDCVVLEGNTLGGESIEVEIPIATTTTAGVMSAEDKNKLDSNTDKIQSILGTTNIVFDFSTGSVSAYQKRLADYNFQKGKLYKIEVITNDTTETYFSLRNSSDPETALQNKLGRGNGARSFMITAEEDANSLCMSLAESGVAIAYDVVVMNVSDVNLGTLGNSVSEIADSLTPSYSFFTKLPTLDDFVDGIYLNTKGNIASSSQYIATEEYFPVKKGTTLYIRSYQYSSNPHLCVYDTEKNFVKSYGVGGTFIDTITFDSDCYIRVSTVNIHMRKAQYVLIVTDGSKQSLEYKSDYVGVPVYSDFEIGNISITASGWTYPEGNKKRVRLKEGVTYHLERGDKIEMNEDVRCYIGYRIGDTYFDPTPSEWFKDSLTITEEGDYTLLFAKIKEDNELSSVYDLLKNVKIYSRKFKNDNNSPQNGNVMVNLLSSALPTMRVVNHRGYCGEAPENTESAYILSKLNGFEYVETDVRFTSDNVPVLLHDTTIDRTSNGTGNISEMTYEEVSQYDFGSWFDTKYAGEKILTFDRFMMLCKKMGLKPYIEMKNIPTGLEQTLIDIVDKYGMRKHVSWISFSDSILRRMLAILPDARIGYVGVLSEELIATAVSLKNDTNEVFIDIEGGSNPKPTVELVLSARSQGLDIEMWNHYSSPDLYPYLDGITTDNLRLWEWSNGKPVWSL